MKRIALFVSGSGTNMENLIRKMQAGEVPAIPCLVISDTLYVKAIDKARALGVPVEVVARKTFASKEMFEDQIIRLLERERVDLIVLAGFMRILSSAFVHRYSRKIINIHPALLPSFPGAHGIRDAFLAKVPVTGVTVHYVDEGVDTGPVILQREVPVLPDDTLESLEKRIHAVEYELYPEALKRVLLNDMKIEDRK